MEEAARARRAAREAIADITPDRLRDAIETVLAEASMTPGVLVLLAAESVDAGQQAGVEERAAGVQLIYEGLCLTRAFIEEEPWQDADGYVAADLDVLIADVLVSRGFSLLSHTPAATKAVETVQSFGREETNRREPSSPTPAPLYLEAHVFELAAIAGSTANGGEPDAVVAARFDAVLTAIDELPLPEPATVAAMLGEPTVRAPLSDGGPDEHVSTGSTDS